MEGGSINFWGQLAIGLIGGLIGSVIISLIEISRYKRDKKRWNEEDK
jgi:hypothetical protein